MPKGKLFVLPNLLTYHSEWTKELPSVLEKIVPSLDGLICESEKQGRRFLAHFREHLTKPVQQVEIAVIEKGLRPSDVNFLLEPLMQGKHLGIVVDAGLPCIADPGSKLVAWAHKQQVPVEAIAGPSAILLAIQLSGFYAQHFQFLGYLQTEEKARKQQIRSLDRKKRDKLVTVFIEAPYKNERTLQDLLEHLDSQSKLCIACDLLTDEQEVIVGTVADLQKRSISIKKRPCVFVIESL